MAELKATLMDENAVYRALKRIAHEIAERNNGCSQLCLVGIQRRGVPLAERIADDLEKIEGIRPPVGVLDITFYRDDLSTVSVDPVIKNARLPFSVTDQRIVLVDDVLYTGRTVRAAMDALISLGRPAEIQLAVLIDRGHRELPIRGDYVGKNVPTAKSETVFLSIPPFEEDCAVTLYE